MNKSSGLRSWAAVGLCTVFFLSGAVYGAEGDARARKIMEDVLRQDTHHDITMKANFQIFDSQGNGAKKEFIFRRMGTPGNTKTEVVFTGPKEIRGVALLSVNQQGSPERQFVYTPATERVRDVVPRDRSARFIGTDFTFEDIGEPALDGFSYRVLGEGEKLDGRKTFKIEAVPLDSSRSQYKFIYYWVAQDVPVVLFEELYDAQGQKVRVLHATDVKHEGGIWGARHTEMRTVADGTRTVLTIDSVKFDTKPNEVLFTPQGLSGALGAGK